MPTRGSWMAGCGASLLMLLGASAARAAPASQAIRSRVEAAITNVMTLERPGQDGFAAIWDGNKYVQCRQLRDQTVRCEAAGALMQPSLAHVLVPEKVERLAALGWRIDPSFGNYTHTFPALTPVDRIADVILDVLAEGYGAELSNLEVQSNWIASDPCPPRNGPRQNLAGLINDAPSMAATAIHACVYSPRPNPEDLTPRSAADLIGVYGARVAGEIQRLQINRDERIFIALDTGVGYVQCQFEPSSQSIYCESASADSSPLLAAVLTPERMEHLHAAGFADPGRSPNYAKSYSADHLDAAAVARELLTILHDVYGYSGSPKLRIITEKGGG